MRNSMRTPHARICGAVAQNVSTGRRIEARRRGPLHSAAGRARLAGLKAVTGRPSPSRSTNMARLSPITSKEQVVPEAHSIVDGIVESRGTLQGPFSMFLHAPELAERVAHLGAYVRFEGGLDMRVRVLAAMTVARELDALYVWGAQTGSARRQGVPESTIAAIRERHS